MKLRDKSIRGSEAQINRLELLLKGSAIQEV